MNLSQHSSDQTLAPSPVEAKSPLDLKFESIRSMPTNRVEFAALERAGKHWSLAVAERIISQFPDRPMYTCAAGISPSGVVHFGNFRDVMTSMLVIHQLRALGKEARFIFSWDNYDRLRKVPNGVDPSFKQFIGRPLCEVPDPEGKVESYARHFELPFERTMQDLGIELEYRYQGKEYRSGRYLQPVLEAMRNRTEIADILLAHMSEKSKEAKSIDPARFRDTYFPIAVYSRFSGKDDTTVLDFDGASTIIYRCHETGGIDKVNLAEHPIAKLAWKVDWPMRWREEQVVFEPGGHDHASPNGSYDVSARLCASVFGHAAPLFVGYEFIGIQGLAGKMSGSKGGALSPGDLLQVYEPDLLKWLYARKRPDQAFNLAFDSDVVRLYDEYDRAITGLQKNTVSEFDKAALAASTGAATVERGVPISFRQAAGLGQSVDWKPEKVKEANALLNLGFDDRTIAPRLERARHWLEEYNPEQMFRLRAEPNMEYARTMTSTGRAHVQQLHDTLRQEVSGLKEIERLVYAIPKNGELPDTENKARQRAFFKDVYQLLFGSETGPRLSTLLWSLDRERVLRLLDVHGAPQ